MKPGLAVFYAQKQNNCTKPNIKLIALVALFATKAHHILLKVQISTSQLVRFWFLKTDMLANYIKMKILIQNLKFLVFLPLELGYTC